MTQDGVRAVASIEKGTKIPVDSEAWSPTCPRSASSASTSGPGSTTGRGCKPGSVVAEKDTGLPLADQHVLPARQDADRPGRRRGRRTRSPRELGVAFGDPDLDLRRLYEQGDRTLGTLETLQPATISLIERGQVPLQTLSDNSDQFLQFSKDVQALTASLHQANPDLKSADAQRHGPRPRAARACWPRTGPRSPTCSARADGQRDRRRPPAGPDDLAGLRAAPGEGDDRRHPRRLRTRRTRPEPLQACKYDTRAAPARRAPRSAPRLATASAPRSTRSSSSAGRSTSPAHDPTVGALPVLLGCCNARSDHEYPASRVFRRHP